MSTAPGGASGTAPNNVNGTGVPDGGLRLRAVEMVRRGSRNPTSTLFVTDADPEELTTDEVASAYLSRWPHQEQRFRDARNGMGLDRSHGYGGGQVAHVGLETALEKATRRVERARKLVAATADDQQLSLDLQGATQPRLRDAASNAVRRAKRDHAAAHRSLAKAEKELRRLETTPREIYVRDTTRDGIMTCLKLTALMLGAAVRSALTAAAWITLGSAVCCRWIGAASGDGLSVDGGGAADPFALSTVLTGAG